jgi:hypothetical protein
LKFALYVLINKMTCYQSLWSYMYPIFHTILPFSPPVANGALYNLI